MRAPRSRLPTDPDQKRKPFVESTLEGPTGPNQKLPQLRAEFVAGLVDLSMELAVWFPIFIPYPQKHSIPTSDPHLWSRISKVNELGKELWLPLYPSACSRIAPQPPPSPPTKTKKRTIQGLARFGFLPNQVVLTCFLSGLTTSCPNTWIDTKNDLPKKYQRTASPTPSPPPPNKKIFIQGLARNSSSAALVQGSSKPNPGFPTLRHWASHFG